jgi:hypothetical protein
LRCSAAPSPFGADSRPSSSSHATSLLRKAAGAPTPPYGHRRRLDTRTGALPAPSASADRRPDAIPSPRCLVSVRGRVGGVAVSITAWICLGFATWAALGVALVVAWVLGQVICRRDEQRPRPELISGVGPPSGRPLSRHSPNRASAPEDVRNGVRRHVPVPIPNPGALRRNRGRQGGRALRRFGLGDDPTAP